jgi:hypothetical protein
VLEVWIEGTRDCYRKFDVEVEDDLTDDLGGRYNTQKLIMVQTNTEGKTYLCSSTKSALQLLNDIPP